MNRRPVDFRQLEKLLQRVFSQAAGLDPTALKFPVCVVSLELNDCACATAGFDPNLEPNKQRVGLACAGMLLAGLEHHLRQIYGLRVSSEADDSVVGGDDELNDSYGQLLKNCADAELAAQSCVKDDDSGGSRRQKGENGAGKLLKGKANAAACLTMIGHTQPSEEEEEGSGRKTPPAVRDFIRCEDSGGNYETKSGAIMFDSEENAEATAANNSGDGRHNSVLEADSGGGGGRRHSPVMKTVGGRHSPVLKAAMFHSPEGLPGRDALYIQR